MKSLLVSITILLNGAVVALAAEGGFLFATFKGEDTPMGEQIYFALSEDGRNWEALNDAEPVLVSGIGEKGVRDPYLIRAHDNSKFYLLATDLSVHLIDHDWSHAVRAGSKSIVIWESTDLVNWSEPRLVPVAPDDAGCAWAPEAIYDEEAQDYLVFWASTTERDGFAKHRIWARRTPDFRTFGEPFVYIEKPTAVIDTTIVYENGNYFRFTKDEAVKNMTMETSPQVAGSWREVSEFTLADVHGYEGPLCFLLEPGSTARPATWCLMLDRYSKGTGYEAFVSHDLSSGQFAPESNFSFPFRFRHGTALPLTESEFQRLQTTFGN